MLCMARRTTTNLHPVPSFPYPTEYVTRFARQENVMGNKNVGKNDSDDGGDKMQGVEDESDGFLSSSDDEKDDS